MRLEWRSSKAFVFGTYEREVVRTLCKVVREGSTVLHIGAHIGYFTLLLAKLAGPEGMVFAFEPFPENFQVLKENIEMNGYPNVVVENQAVAAISGRTSLCVNDDDQLTYTASLVHGRPTLEVEATKMDDYASRFEKPIQFVMMDVEGAESEVLEGMRNLLGCDRPTLLIELHGFDELRQSHPALRTLRNISYSFRFLEVGGAQVHVLAEPRSGRDT